ncbi:MAG: hypothetical protein LBU58_03365, partial [Clostridiales bacterium]|nr:hypothetical protein [Clostridiales bacterium]
MGSETGGKKGGAGGVHGVDNAGGMNGMGGDLAIVGIGFEADALNRPEGLALDTRDTAVVLMSARKWGDRVFRADGG